MSRNVKRNVRTPPSVRKHGLSAVLLLLIIVFSVWAWLNFTARHKPVPLPKVETALPENAPVEKAEKVEKLPDLLAEDNIPPDVNPTETVKLAGEMDEKPKREVRKPVKMPVIITGQSLKKRREITNYTPLPPAPFAGLSRMSAYGAVPSPDKNGRTPFRAYAKSFTPDKNRRYISLVVGGLGLNPQLTRRAISELPGPITLSFAANAPGLQGWIDKARAHGHEVLIELPMEESPDVERPLSVQQGKVSNLKHLDYHLSRAQGYFAVTNYGGDALVQNETALAPIIKALKDDGLGFVYDGGIKNSRVLPLAKRIGLPALSGDLYLDEDKQDIVSVFEHITKLFEDSYEHVPVGMGFAYPGTIDGIISWLSVKPESQGIAPVSFAIKTR